MWPAQHTRNPSVLFLFSMSLRLRIDTRAAAG
jgi:hypothetical protein